MSLTSTYEVVVLGHIATLLFLYPYGVSLGSGASVRVPDLPGFTCLALGAATLLLAGSARSDRAFLFIAGPFLLMELVSPLIGGIAYDTPSDVVSSLRIAILWLPMVFLTLLSPAGSLTGFERQLRALLVTSLWLNVAYAVLAVRTGNRC